MGKLIYWMLFLCLCWMNNFTFCNLDDFFKKAENKGNYHNIRNIDFIYMLNLDKRPEKFKKSADQLIQYQIYPYRFSAINGWEDLTLETINGIGVKFDPKRMMGGFMASCYPLEANGKEVREKLGETGRTYFVHWMSKGAIACALSHLSILQDAWDEGYETIWVMEDDIAVVRDPREISDLIDDLDRLVGKYNWDILFTDIDMRIPDKNIEGWRYNPCFGTAKRPDFNPINPNKYDLKINVSDKFRRIGSRFGTHSMIIRRGGMKKILDFEKKYKIYLPIDMDMFLPIGIKCYTVREDIVTNIYGGGVRYCASYIWGIKIIEQFFRV